MQSRSEIAIVGYACRVPGARHSDELWQLLRSNRCSVTWITPDRFPTGAFYHPSHDQIGRSYTFAAGVIDDVWGFDAGAFGMSPREAEQADPQHRHLLEVTYDALTHAGIRPSSLAGSDTGVYVGASSVDHATRLFADPSMADVHMMTGNSLSIMANRISYTLDVRGPSIALDTACSSSLVALSLAADAIRNGAVDTAIVGGVNLLLSPFSFIGFSRASMLSPTGLCRPFDAAADGYVRAEGTVVVVLRSMAAARKARNRIHAVIVGSGMNQDGRTTGLSLPSADSQRRLLEQVYGDFAVNPADLAFVEAHGTGTQVGDPIEADALGKGLGQRRSQPLPIGSIKSNIGHLEPVSGLAGMLKSVLALNHNMVPATLHQQSPSPNIPLDELNLKVIDRNWHLPERRGPRLAGVNSFGFGGTNAHVILRSDDAAANVVQVRTLGPPPALLLTAHSANALPALASAYLDQWPDDKRLAAEFISASAHSRDPLVHRVLIRGGTTEEIRHQVEQFIAGEKSATILTGQAHGTDLPVAFLFSGNGSQWAGMGRTAWRGNRLFRDALTDVDTHFSAVQSWSLVDMLFDDDIAAKLRRATYAQPLLLGLQVATVRALEEAGIFPTAVMGHSVGEIAAAWAAGALSLKQAIDVVTARSRHQESLHGSGGMAALMLSDREARRFLNSENVPGVDIAAVNSWRSVTVSGPVAEIDQVLAAATSLKISARRLDLDYPFHSSIIDAVRAPLMRELDGLKPHALRKRLVSTVTGDFAEAEALGAEHWWRNVREPVRFEAALEQLLKEGFRVFAEIGPKPILGSYVRDVLRESGERGAVIETLTEDEQAIDPIDQTVSKVLLAGGSVDLRRFFGSPPATAVSLPLYPWQHTQFMVRQTVEASSLMDAARHPLLGLRLRRDCTEWFSTVDPVLFPWINDHMVGGVAVFPASAYVDVMLAAAREIHADDALEARDLDIILPLVFDGSTSFETLLRLSPETGVAEFLSRPRGSEPDWTLNARGIIGRSPVTGKATALPTAPDGTVVVAKPKVYDAARKLGFDYGPSFQRARLVAFPHPKRAISTLVPPLGLCITDHVIDLTGLDTAFHGLFASEEAGVADMPMKRMLPVRFGCVRAFADAAPATHAVARTVRQSLTSIVVDIDLFDASGKVVVSAENVRLIEAPAELTVDPQSVSYHTAAWRLDRAGHPAVVGLPGETAALPAQAEGPLAEGLLLLEAGCLRAAWTALGAAAAHDVAPAGTDQDAEWRAFLKSAVLWHLEANGLAVEQDGDRTLAAECELPDADSIVTSLVVSHSEMAAEAASLSRLQEILGRMIAGDASVSAEFGSAHWRQLGTASSQIATLRTAVVADVATAIAQCESDRRLRLLMIGADHIAAAGDLALRFRNVEIAVTDRDSDRLEQVRAQMSDDHPRVRCLPWAEIDSLPANSLDLVFAIDSLSEIAAAPGGLDPITRVLRPNAPLVAGELAPSLFWDLVRGTRPSWWARSANADFPVGALLTSQEWLEDFRAAGFTAVTATPLLGEAHIGVVIHGLVANSLALAGRTPHETPVFAWEGEEFDEASVLHGLRQRVIDLTSGRRRVDFSNGDTTPEISSINDNCVTGEERREITDIAWTIDARSSTSEPVADLGSRLTEIADRCRRLAAAPARLWIIVNFDEPDADASPLNRPLWCAIASAMRVAQNEYSGLEIRCLGLSGAASLEMLDRVAEEMIEPDGEREIFFTGESRTVIRIERGTADSAPRELAKGTALRLSMLPGRGALGWVSAERAEPMPGEVEIEVATTGLNFRDVMWNLHLLPEEAIEDGYAGAALGMECAGTVTRVGPGVEGLAEGDRVVAFVPRAFASHVVAPAFAVSPLPSRLSFEAATTLPVAFLTAYYSLVHLGRLTRDETVLVHGGAGAVGLAAIQIAKHCGARVIATAGSDEKRAFLRSIGADHVCNSRTLTFADEVSTYTGGKGVDVVLNSLAGQAMIRSMDCLKPFGRFIELGKRDFYANTHIGLRPLRRNLTYFGVDVDQLIGEHRELTSRLFGELMQLFAEGKLVPLPHRVFDGRQVADAFRLMQRAGHIGKIVVVPADRASGDLPAQGTFPVTVEGVHVVIGGTSGFGLATAEWLVGRGARHLALISRSGQLSDLALDKVNALRRKGAEVDIVAADVADQQVLERLFASITRQRPIKGIVHAAMALDDRLIEGMDRTSIELALRPKIAGALNLERLAPDLKLDYLLFYSSATTLFGNPGQYNYVAANAFMEGLARRMRAQNQPAIAICWGGIEDAGYLSRHIASDANLKKRFASSLITAQMALDGLDWIHDHAGKATTACCAIARIDWTTAKRELAATRSPTFDVVSAMTGKRQGMDTAATLEKLRTMAPEDATEALLEIVVEEIARVLRLPPKEVDRHRPLAEIGMDSLMMLELRITVEATLQIELPMMSLASGITPADVARRIAPLILGDGQKESVPSTIIALSTSHFATEADASSTTARRAAVSAVLERVRELEGPR
ncbi:MAG: SDR family NAD(P)-dependent oxidoreductase [Reyranella sp.]|nr:SDR family NAD(P)-dependent oxidoreductase [Reyranella sp.]